MEKIFALIFFRRNLFVRIRKKLQKSQKLEPTKIHCHTVVINCIRIPLYKWTNSLRDFFKDISDQNQNVLNVCTVTKGGTVLNLDLLAYNIQCTFKLSWSGIGIISWK